MAPAVSGWSPLALTVRVPRSNAPQSLEEFERSRTLTVGTRTFIDALVRARCNILICGDTGAGKTALLRACCKCIDPEEVVVSVEDRAELLLNVPGRDHKVFHGRTIALDTVSGAWKGATVPVTMEDQVRHALRHRPRRFILGEARGGEMFDVCHAMTSGHSGSMVTIHATTAVEAIQRAELLVAQSPMARGQYDFAQKLVRMAIHACIHLGRDEETGKRVVDGIVTYSSEGAVIPVYGMEDGRIQRMCGADLAQLPDRVASRLRRLRPDLGGIPQP
jgi:pilus assembly protein CpaF